MTGRRAELPAEFQDYTDSKLLVQPQNQYPYCSLFKSALAIRLAGAALDKARSPSGGGDAYIDASQDRLMLASRIPTALFQVKADFNKTRGHVIKFNRPKFTSTTYTLASRQVKTNQTISTTPANIMDSEQNKLEIVRVAGPYDSTNSAPAPIAIEDFDANLSVHDLYDMAGTHLVEDFDHFLDAWLVATADSGTGATVYPEGMTANDDATQAGQYPFTYEQTSRASKEMDEANLPRFNNGRRMMMVTPTGKKQLKDDPQFARYAEAHTSQNPLFPGYFGSTPEFDFGLSNTLTTASNSSSVAVHYGHAIAPGAFMAGTGRAPRMALASDDNYGETPKIIWLADLANGLADSRFVKSIRYTEDAQ